MALPKDKLRYLSTSTSKLLAGAGLACPSCGNAASTVESRKNLVTALRRCNACQLLFRTPTTSPEENKVFYQDAYTQGFTTDMPSIEQLEALKASGFKGGEKDYSAYISLLTAIGCKSGDTLFDYGCSWGYGSWQFAQAGYNVTAFEISLPRCEYARTNLGINAHTKEDEVQGPFDIFFSSHVLEHVPSIAKSIAYARKIVKPGGWFVGLTPNGSDAFRAKHPDQWNRFWGMVHPNFLDNKFYSFAFKSDQYLLASSPYDLETIKHQVSSLQDSNSLDLSGSELLVVARLAKK